MLLFLFICCINIFSSDLLSDTLLFNTFIKTYEKAYTNIEKQRRFLIFRTNIHKIKQLNDDAYPLTEFAITQFSDLTENEFREKITCVPVHERFVVTIEDDEVDNLPNIDWVSRGAVSSVKNQGSCWAFSAIGVMEGLSKTRAGHLKQFSAQQLVDCDGQEHGCNGGWPIKALNYAKNGMEAWEGYRYHAVKQHCKFEKRKIMHKFHGGTRVTGEKNLGTHLRSSPVSVCIDANVLQHYKSGIIHGSQCKGRSINHAVLLVGSNNNHNYWRVKNSWGTGWGERGYFRVKHGVNCLAIANDGAIGHWDRRIRRSAK